MDTLTGGTLSLDIGGSGIKGMVLDPDGQPLNDRVRIPTPRPATPDAVVDTIGQVATQQPEFERVSAGFPGVVEFGVVKTGANFDGDWSAVPLAEAIEELTGKPTRWPTTPTSCRSRPMLSCRSRRGRSTKRTRRQNLSRRARARSSSAACARRRRTHTYAI